MTGLMVALHRHDERALHFLVVRRSRLLDRFMRMLTRLADPLPAVLLAVLLSDARTAFALALSHACVQLVKRSCCRPRPSLPIGVVSLIHAPDRFSFPSGHSAAAMSLGFGMAMMLPPLLSAGVMGLALTLGISRCYLGVHYPGDVLAGWLLAIWAYALGGAIF